MRYENLEAMIIAWEMFMDKVLAQTPEDPREKIIFKELVEFSSNRIDNIQISINNGIDEYNNGNNATESGVKYPTYIEYVENLKKDSKYWREQWKEFLNVHDHNRLLQDKLKTLSTEAADIISRLESELKEAQTAADDYKKQYLTCFHKFLKLEEENAILRGDISEDGLERY